MAPARSVPHDDLFETFPDLPRLRRDSRFGSAGHLAARIAEMRARASQNILRQRAAAAAVRAQVARRQETMLARRDASLNRRRA